MTYDYIDREFSVLNCKYVFKIRKMKTFIDELEVWLLKRDLLYAANLLGLIGLKSLSDIHKIKEDDFAKIKLGDKQKQSIMEAIKVEIEEQANNLPKRLEKGANKINKIGLEVYKEMIP
jgi:hypothetical protein